MSLCRKCEPSLKAVLQIVIRDLAARVNKANGKIDRNDVAIQIKFNSQIRSERELQQNPSKRLKQERKRQC